MRKGKPPKRAPLVTELDRLDCAGLDRVVRYANLRHRGRDKITAAELGRFAAPLGGAKHRQLWSKYINGTRAIPLFDKMVVCLYFPEYRPQDIFPSWPFSAVTQVPAKSRFPILAHLIASASMSGADQQELLIGLVELFLSATPPQREAIVRKAQEAVVLGAK